MNIIKLKYESKEIGITDLLSKGIILSEETWETPPIHSVVDLGLSVAIKGTYDELGNELTPPVYDGYCFDLMISDIVLEDATFDEDGNELTPIVYKVWDFGSNEIHPNSPDHTFAGYEPIIITDELPGPTE